MAADLVTVRTPDGRDLEVLRSGPADGATLVYHGGTPSAVIDFPPLADPVIGRGWQFVAYSRPGYAGSTPRPGRSVSAAVDDVVAILDALSVTRFVTLGWSGGGPHALACAALLPRRCIAATSLAGVAPRDAVGLDFLSGMGPENVEEFGAALKSSEALTEYLETQVPGLAGITGDRVAAELGGLIDEVDRAALTGELADLLAATLRRSVSAGIAGWRDDDLAFVRPWGFRVSDVTVPVAVWQGAHDRMVPIAHGRWLAGRMPGARVHLYDEEGHLSLLPQLPRIIDDLAGLAQL